jgi:hypothetical protein
LPGFARGDGDALHSSPESIGAVLFAGAAAVAAAAFAAGVAAVVGEGFPEASAGGYTGAVGVAASCDGSVSTTADDAAEAVAAPSAVVVAVGEEDGDEAAVTVGALLLDALLVGWEVGAELVVDDVVLFVDAALHLGFLAAGEEGESGCGEEWGGDLG